MMPLHNIVLIEFQLFFISMCLRIMKNLFLIIFSLVLFSCEENASGPCDNQGKEVYCFVDTSAFLSYKDDISAYVLRYHVPGTIDSFYTGVICKKDLTSIDVDHSTNDPVIFSGCFLDDGGEINPSVVIAGEEFFYMDLEKISLDN